MSPKVKLYGLSDANTLITSPTNVAEAVLPSLCQGDSVPIEFRLYERATTGGFTTAPVLSTGTYDIHIGITNPAGDESAAKYAESYLYIDRTNQYRGIYSGTLSLSTTGISSLLGANASAAAALEVEVFDATDRITFLGDVTVYADGLKRAGDPLTVTDTTYVYSKAEVDDLFLGAGIVIGGDPPYTQIEIDDMLATMRVDINESGTYAYAKADVDSLLATMRVDVNYSGTYAYTKAAIDDKHLTMGVPINYAGTYAYTKAAVDDKHLTMGVPINYAGTYAYTKAQVDSLLSVLGMDIVQTRVFI